MISCKECARVALVHGDAAPIPEMRWCERCCDVYSQGYAAGNHELLERQRQVAETLAAPSDPFVSHIVSVLHAARNCDAPEVRMRLFDLLQFRRTELAHSMQRLTAIVESICEEEKACWGVLRSLDATHYAREAERILCIFRETVARLPETRRTKARENLWAWVAEKIDLESSDWLYGEELTGLLDAIECEAAGRRRGEDNAAEEAKRD